MPWVAAGIAGVNALVSVGFAVSAVVSESTTTAWYAADRAGALLVALVVVAALRNRAGVLVVGWMLTGVQAADAVVGIGAGSVVKTVGPIVLALATGIALSRARQRG